MTSKEQIHMMRSTALIAVGVIATLTIALAA
jgi:hypothetical protein